MKKHPPPNSTVTIARLERGVKIAARIVQLYGEHYLPVFTRLYRELDEAKETNNKKQIALELAKKYSELNV